MLLFQNQPITGIDSLNTSDPSSWLPLLFAGETQARAFAQVLTEQRLRATRSPTVVFVTYANAISPIAHLRRLALLELPRLVQHATRQPRHALLYHGKSSSALCANHDYASQVLQALFHPMHSMNAWRTKFAGVRPTTELPEGRQFASYLRHCRHLSCYHLPVAAEPLLPEAEDAWLSVLDVLNDLPLTTPGRGAYLFVTKRCEESHGQASPEEFGSTIQKRVAQQGWPHLNVIFLPACEPPKVDHIETWILAAQQRYPEVVKFADVAALRADTEQLFVSADDSVEGLGNIYPRLAQIVRNCVNY